MERGLDVNAQDKQGNTAMHGAASRGADQVVQFLADHGAKLDVRSQTVSRGFNAAQGEAAKTIPGRTPIEEAMVADPPRVSTIALLRKLLGMDPNAPLPKLAATEADQ